MITETREIYKCEFCRKVYQIRGPAERHEVSCSKNPDNWRPCHSCIHLKKKKHTIYVDTYTGEQEYRLDLLYCPAIKTFLYPPKVEHKRNTGYDLGDETNQPMPRTCDVFNGNFNDVLNGKF